MMAKNYRELTVWQTAMDIITDVYRLTMDWPPDEKFGLTAQARRSAVSNAANIAEGDGRGTDPEFSRFLRIAHGSVRELETHLLIATRLDFRSTIDPAQIIEALATLGRQIQAIIKHLNPPSMS